ncbi:procathepsin L-like [Daphnia carinata]|uniref:procathepsin L-like n=1 Tax=Daphnia carinata TaxID=120202 RepID=UPI00257B5672|nr:procathepsin L-like [Daphnia carinata]
MKLQVLVLFATLAVAVAQDFLQDDENRDSTDDADWERFKAKHKKKFKNKDRERIRKNRFVQHNRQIKKHNQMGKSSYTLQANQFTDWSEAELEQLKGEIDTDNEIPGPVVSTDILRQSVPDAVDLRKNPCMPKVKYQGGCGSCYSFAATTPIEFQRCQKTGKLVTLSEENIVDCSQKYGNAGCNGGLALRAWNYVKDIGINTEEAYPYQGEETLCEYSASNYGGNVTSWSYATRSNDEEAMKAVVANYGPLAVSIDATNWEFYSSGVFSSAACSNTSTNHAVVIVGYGKDENSNKPYWIVRNSWGPEWGQDGYIYLERGANMCAVSKRAVFPTAHY